MPVTAHDAVVALRPYLGKVHDAQERFDLSGGYANADVGDLIAAQAAALDAALDLLGVQS
jgi:hypothetical protein